MNIIELLTESFYQTSRSKRDTSSYYETFSSREESSYPVYNPYATSASYETLSDLRVGAFNVRVFGRSKVADEDVFNILVQVHCSLFNYAILVST